MKVSSGRLEVIDRFETQLISPRKIYIWLPEGYSDEKKYAVLYMHDGAALFDSTTTWNGQEWDVDGVISKLSEKNQIKDCIVVGIDNGGAVRITDYTPQKVYFELPKTYRSYLESMKNSDGSPRMVAPVASDNYLKFIVNELKPYVDGKYSTFTDQANTFIMGSSMGGLISIYAICEYPEIFGGAACLSTHWIISYETENNPFPALMFDYLKNNLPDPQRHKLYFDFGTETLDSLYEPFQDQADLVIREKGYTSENWTTKKFPGANHSENAWKERLDIPLLFLLGDN